MEITTNWVDVVPPSEFSPEFIQHMADSMSVSWYKYGKVRDAKGKVDLIDSIERRLKKYQSTGNTEWLVDVANFAMMEFMFPSHSEAHFKGTDSGESPGRKFLDDGRVDKTRKNNDL